MTASSALIEKRNELDAKREQFAKALEGAKTTSGTYDDAKLASGLGVAETGLKDELQRRRKEIDAIALDVEVKVSEERLAEIKADADRNGIVLPGAGATREPNYGKGLGTLFIESLAYKNRAQRAAATVQVSVKTLMQSDGAGGGGWDPATPDLPGYTAKAVRPAQILSFIPKYRTTADTIAFMEETTHTDNAVEKAQGAAFGEQAYVFTRQTRIVEKIPAAIPVTDEQLDDVEGIEDFLNQALGGDVLRRLDLQVMAGNGTSPNLAGILDHADIQTQAKGADPTFDAIMKAITKVRVTGRAFPNVVFLHSNDYQELVLTRTTDGLYILGNPAGAPVDRIWGLALVPNEANTEGTGVVVDTSYCGLYVKKDLTFAVGYVNAQFAEGEKTVTAQIRAAHAFRRGAAACTVTGI